MRKYRARDMERKTMYEVSGIMMNTEGEVARVEYAPPYCELTPSADVILTQESGIMDGKGEYDGGTSGPIYYEGDIVQTDDDGGGFINGRDGHATCGVVMYSDEYAGFGVVRHGDAWYPLHEADKSIVVANIYENPDFTRKRTPSDFF
jgi:hypothetical protein